VDPERSTRGGGTERGVSGGAVKTRRRIKEKAVFHRHRGGGEGGGKTTAGLGGTRHIANKRKKMTAEGKWKAARLRGGNIAIEKEDTKKNQKRERELPKRQIDLS